MHAGPPLPAVTAPPSGRRAALRYQQQQRQQQKQQRTAAPPPISPAAAVEIDTLKCPLSCVCQYARFTDLSISRWINYMQMRQPEEPTPRRRGAYAAQAIKNNEVTYEEDQTELELEDDDVLAAAATTSEEDSESDEESFPTNPFIKQATCILQEQGDEVALINSLPHDLHALILLYTGIGRNKTVNLSVLKTLNQLNTLEVRGPQDRTLRLVFDEPLSFLQHVNFESVTLLGSDSYNRPKNPKHPSDSFDYKPKSEFVGNYDGDAIAKSADDLLGPGGIKLNFKQLDEKQLEELEILPYEVYMQQVKEASMPSFYGWRYLEVLRIHACQLNELYWEVFDGLAALQHLSLERNNIEMVPPFALYGALHIKTLSLAHNRIQDLHYRALAGLLDLKWLDLSDNRLGKLSELSFPPFPRLVRVDFRQNPIRYIFPATFWVMNATREMYFDSRETALELWTNTPFVSLVELRELYLGNVSIPSLEHDIFKGLVSLEKLTLKGYIGSVEFDAFVDLAHLRELDMSNCQIGELSMDALMGCKRLESLNLSHNNISYIPPGLFDDQTVLQEIYLQSNHLRVLPHTFFLQPKLRVARLNDNPWQCNCDMSNWRPKITNQERAARKKRCVSDFQTGRQLNCRQVDEFKFDHRFAPRCSNYNEQSVYYVLRKQLQCGPGRVVTSKLHRNVAQRLPNRRKVEEHHQQQTRTKQKIHRNRTEINTLEYVLQQQLKAQARMQQRQRFSEQTQKTKTRQQQLQQQPQREEQSAELSNDILI